MKTNSKKVRVKKYIRKNDTVVESHLRTCPDQFKSNNINKK